MKRFLVGGASTSSPDASISNKKPKTSLEGVPSTSSSSNSKSSNKFKIPPTRKYIDTYLKFGFTVKAGTEKSCPIPQCIICKECLSNQSLKPSLLKRHQSTKHPETEDKPIDFFKRKQTELEKESVCMKSFTRTDTNLLKASYLVSLRIAQDGKPHTIGESLIFPAAKDIVNTVLGAKAAKEIEKIPLSNSTVQRRIDDMALNVEETLALYLQQCTFFALQIDESTDITNMAQLLVFIRFDHVDEILEDFLFCKPLLTNTKAENIFELIHEYLTKIGLPWSKCVGVCTDGARAMYGKLTGLAARIKKDAPQCQATHCMIHREALASKNMPGSLSKVLQDSVKVINFIKGSTLNSRLFAILCDDTCGIFKNLLFHTEVRWLSRGNILTRLFELRSEVLLFLSEKDKNNMKSMFVDELWLQRLAYLSDIFSRLNTLNMGLQGAHETSFSVKDKLNSFLRKLDLFVKQTKQKDISSFTTLSSWLQENELTPSDALLTDIVHHLNTLKVSFEKYFPDITSTSDDWIRNPFSLKDVPPTVEDKESFIELTCDSTMKDSFKEKSLISFWMGTRNEYPDLFIQVLKCLVRFSTTYLCERGFSELLYVKNKYRNRLSAENDLRLKISSISPDIESFLSKKQQQVSH